MVMLGNLLSYSSILEDFASFSAKFELVEPNVGTYHAIFLNISSCKSVHLPQRLEV